MKKADNNEFEFTEFTAHQNDELLPDHFIMKLHPAKRALAGFVGQTQNMPRSGMFWHAEPDGCCFGF